MVLIVATSALLGGITVAIWSRKTLENMRQPEGDAHSAQPEAAPEEFI